MITGIRLEREPDEAWSDYSMKGARTCPLAFVNEQAGVDEHMKVFGHAFLFFCGLGANGLAEGFGFQPGLADRSARRLAHDVV
jgi:hypothetical protein